MKEEVIKLNDVDFKLDNNKLIPLYGDISGKINAKKKHKQNLNSWKWFYSGFETNLIALRYHKINQIRNGENVLIDKYINEEWISKYEAPKYNGTKAVSHSVTYKNERVIYNKINAELIKINEEQDNYYNKLKERKQ